MPTPTLTPVGERLRALADARGLSTRDVARLIGAAQPTNLSKIYQGKTSPTAETLERILAALGCTWSDLDLPKTTTPNRGASR
jgi:transcriptional regulator with XRE-family HTH domain